MEKKETIAAHQPIGVCEKLYNAFVNRPSLIPLRRPRLTSGGNAAEEQAPDTKSRPSVIAKGEEKVASATNSAPADGPPAVMSPFKKENLDTKPTNPTLPYRPQTNLKDTNDAQLSGKPSEREKLATLMQQRSEKQQPAAAAAPPSVPASTLAAASQGKTAAPFVPKAAPTSSPAVPSTVAADIAKAAAQVVTKAETGKEKAVAALSSIVEKAGKAAPPGRAPTKGTEMPESFLKRARDSVRGVGSANGAAQKQK